MSTPPAKPWERARGGATPSSVDISAVAQQAAATQQQQDTSTPNAAAGNAGNVLARGDDGLDATTSYNNNNMNYGSAFGGGGYGGSSLYGGSSMYGGGMYGGGGYGSSYGSGMYGSGMYGSSMYGGGMYGNRYGGGYGGYGGYGGGMFGGMGMGMGMGGMGGMGMNPQMQGGPPAPPSGWQTLLRLLHTVMDLFGRITFLVDENVHALNFFISAVLMLVDRSGSLYAELARFVLRMLGFKIPKSLRPPQPPPMGPNGMPMGPNGMNQMPGQPPFGPAAQVGGVNNNTNSNAADNLGSFWPGSSEQD